MWGNNMVVDLSLITLDNLAEYQLLFRKKRKPRGLNAKGKGTFNMKEYRQSQEYKKYQHDYYIRVTKKKRQEQRRTKSK